MDQERDGNPPSGDDQGARDDLLYQSDELFRLLVQSVKDYAIFMLDPTGHIVSWNTGAQRMKGYAREEILGKHFSIFYVAEDLVSEKPWRELEIAMREGVVEDEGWRVRKDGSRFFANVVITAVHDRDSRLRGFAKVTRDISERRRAEEIRRAMIEQREARVRAEEEKRAAEASFHAAQEASRAKDAFLMTLSHELRTPLTSILGWARLLPTLNSNDESFRPALEAIARAAMLQARLLDDVLDTSRIVSGKLRLTPEPARFSSLIADSIESVRTAANAKEIELRVSVDENVGIIDVDPTRFQQVIWNLLTNAVRFTQPHGRIEVEATRKSDTVVVTVKDNGEGIAREFLPHVFEPFRQAENAGTRTHGGLGLGLSIVRYIVEAHGGKIAASSEGLGRGATFRIELPALRPGASQGRASEPAGEENDRMRHPLRGVRVLLADDDADGREFVRLALEQAGAAVEAVSSAPEALEAFGARPVDVILTDIAMPHVDGYELVKRLRGLSKPLPPVIALTAFPKRELTRDDPFVAFLAKPIEPRTLVDAVARQVR